MAHFDHVEMPDIRPEHRVELAPNGLLRPNAMAFMRSSASQPK
jgi:hypothetical protein